MAEEGDASKVLLRDVMSDEPIFVSEDHGLGQVVSAMRDLAIRRVPVVDAAGNLTGIVAMDDLLILLADQLGDLASAIRDEVREP
jgi:CBS domain-containing protein